MVFANTLRSIERDGCNHYMYTVCILYQYTRVPMISISPFCCSIEEDADTGSLMKMQYEAYIQTLPNCVNKDLIDKVWHRFLWQTEVIILYGDLKSPE